MLFMLSETWILWPHISPQVRARIEATRQTRDALGSLTRHDSYLLFPP